MKINVAYFDEKNLDVGLVAHLPTVEIDTDDGIVVVNGYGLTPRLSSMLKDLAICLADFYDELKKEK